jgi:hypothetical protein
MSNTLYPHQLIVKHLNKIFSGILFIFVGVFLGGMLFIPEEFPNTASDIVTVIIVCICAFLMSMVGDKE